VAVHSLHPVAETINKGTGFCVTLCEEKLLSGYGFWCFVELDSFCENM